MSTSMTENIEEKTDWNNDVMIIEAMGHGIQ